MTMVELVHVQVASGTACQPRFGHRRGSPVSQVQGVPAMPSLGIASLLNRLIVAVLASLGAATGDWIAPLDRADRLVRI